jgi:hypothetical protein
MANVAGRTVSPSFHKYDIPAANNNCKRVMGIVLSNNLKAVLEIFY